MKEQALVLREQAKNQLLEIKTVDEAVDYINKVKAIETYCKAVKEDNEIVKIVAEQKIRSMRLAGQMLQDQELNKGVRMNGENTGGQIIVPPDDKPTLEQLGLTKNESSTYQKIASIPDDEFEQEMEKAKDGDSTRDITVSRFANIRKDNEISKELYHEKKMIEYAKLLGLRVSRPKPGLYIMYDKKAYLTAIEKLFN